MNVKETTRKTYTIEISDDDPLFRKFSRYLNGSTPKTVVKSKGKLPKASKRGRKPKKETALFYCLEPGCTHAPFTTAQGKHIHQGLTGHHDPVAGEL